MKIKNIDTTTSPRIFQQYDLPKIFKTLGVVRTTCGQTGVLVKNTNTGVLFMVNSGVFKRIDSKNYFGVGFEVLSYGE